MSLYLYLFTYYLVTNTPEVFSAITIALYNTVPKIKFIMIAGKTTKLSRAIKLPGRPTSTLAVPKKTNPLTKVPITRATDIL